MKCRRQHCSFTRQFKFKRVDRNGLPINIQYCSSKKHSNSHSHGSHKADSPVKKVFSKDLILNDFLNDKDRSEVDE